MTEETAKAMNSMYGIIRSYSNLSEKRHVVTGIRYRGCGPKSLLDFTRRIPMNSCAELEPELQNNVHDP